MTTKTDLEKIGLFKDMGYYTIGDPYNSCPLPGLDKSSIQGKQMLPGATKKKSALDDGCFSRPFARIMQGESYADKARLQRMMRRVSKENNIGKEWIPSSTVHPINGVGSHHGSFSGVIERLDPSTKDVKQTLAGKSFTTNPGKKGSGHGYVDITIGKYPPHAANVSQEAGWKYHKKLKIKSKTENLDKLKIRQPFISSHFPRPYFHQNPYKFKGYFSDPKPKKMSPEVKVFVPNNPGKRLGGCKAGAFSPFPKVPSSPKWPRTKMRPVRTGVNDSEKIFYPAMGPKSMVTRSIMEQCVVKRSNKTNYKTIEKVY